MSRTTHHHRRRFSERGHGLWHHFCDEVPARAKSRALERLAARTQDLDDVDAVRWPRGRKPFSYYY